MTTRSAVREDFLKIMDCGTLTLGGTRRLETEAPRYLIANTIHSPNTSTVGSGIVWQGEHSPSAAGRLSADTQVPAR